jgi:pectate lyase
MSLWFCIALWALLLPWTVQAQVQAFPSAEGFGAQTVGGQGGRVIEVTNLHNAGAGSFRACVEATGPRTCVFRLGGSITLTSPIYIRAANSFLTIAGQTAPGDGIAIGPWPINIQDGAHDIIMRHVRLRQGYTSSPPDFNNSCGNLFVWGNGGVPVYNIIIDHVSAAWACDDSIQGVGITNRTTLQWMLIGEPYHQPVDGFGGSKGFISGLTAATAAHAALSFHHSLIVHSEARNPAGSPMHLLDWRYNIVYNWRACTGNLEFGGTNDHVQTSYPANVNFVGNKYIGGVDSNTSKCWLGTLWPHSALKMYVQDNESPWCGGAACAPDEWNLGWGDGVNGQKPPSQAAYRVSTPFPAPAVSATPRAQLESVIASQVGATKPGRDALDRRLISEFQSRTGSMGRKGAPASALRGGHAPC